MLALNGEALRPLDPAIRRDPFLSYPTLPRCLQYVVLHRTGLIGDVDGGCLFLVLCTR